jgi:regulator of RNase E activity RraA
MSVGFKIKRIKRRVAPDTVAAFRRLPAANVSDCMSRMFAGGAKLRPMHREGVLAGPAFTVKTRPGDNLMVHKALDIAEAGDVIVVDAGGDLTNAIIGEIMVNHAINRKLAGIVIYGAIRDFGTIRQQDWPVYAAGVTHRGPYKDGPGEIGVPIAVDGMVIEPGDLILGDPDGLVCVPYDVTAKVLADTQAKHAAEEKTLAALVEGKSADRSWIDKSLERLGVTYED